jgi:hypothetical protein
VTTDLGKPITRLSLRNNRLYFRWSLATETGKVPRKKQRRLVRKLNRTYDQVEALLPAFQEAMKRSDGLANQIGAIECVAGLEAQT